MLEHLPAHTTNAVNMCQMMEGASEHHGTESLVSSYADLLARALNNHLLFSSHSPSVHSNPMGSVTLPHK
jgi:hypothetical protein